MKIVEWAAGTCLAYAVALAVWLRPEPWMWRVWAVVAVVLALLAVVVGKFSRAPPAAAVRKMAPGTAAMASFAIIAVLSAVLETRPGLNRTLVFSALALGTMAVAGVFLASYERRTEPASSRT